MSDRRAILGLGAGLLGLGLGAAAAVWHVVALAVIAGALALVAGVSVVRLAQLLMNAGRKIDELSTQVTELESTAQREARRRAQAEAEAAAAVSERIGRTATRGNGESGDALFDQRSGLFSEDYFRVAADGRIVAARRHLRPVAIVLVEVVEAIDSPAARHPDPARVGTVIRSTLRDADTAARLLDGTFALLLEDTPEDGAIWTVERLRRAMAEKEPGLTLWAGVSCYPAHGFTGFELLSAANDALASAREWRQDRIEVATSDA